MVLYDKKKSSDNYIKEVDDMKNNNIGEILKEYRKANKYTVNEVSDLLKQQNFIAAPKTIYGWESNRSLPDADTLLTLCKIYNIEDILKTFGYLKTPNEKIYLTDFERDMIIKYRKHPQMHSAIHKLLDIE